MWDTNVPNGWEKFKEMTTENAKFELIANSTYDDPEHIAKKIYKELNRIKHTSFGKVKQSKRRNDTQLENLIKIKIDIQECNKTTHNEITKIDNEIMNELKRLQRQNVNSKLAKLDKLEKEKGKAAAIFNVKDQIIGSKKENDVPSVVKDPKTNELIFHPSGIKKASVQYCKNLLTNREPLEAFKKERVHQVRMNEELEDDIDLTANIFNNTHIYIYMIS